MHACMLMQTYCTGTLPPNIGKLPYLGWFGAPHNLFNGTLPASWGQGATASSSLTHVFLDSNQVSTSLDLLAVGACIV